MIVLSDINYQIKILNEQINDFVQYSDSIFILDENLKQFTTSDTITKNVKRSIYSAIQTLEELKKDSLQEFKHIVISDTTILNLAFELYGQITEENNDKLIIANDLLAYERLDIDPNNPIIPKGTEILYYK